MFFFCGKLGEEGKRGGFSDFDVHESAGEGRRAVEDDNPVGCRSANQLRVIWAFGGVQVGLFAQAFDEDLYGLAEEGSGEVGAYLFLDGEKLCVAFSLGLVRDAVGEFFVGFGAGAGRVFEDEGVFVFGLLEKFYGCLEIFFGLAGVAHDKITRDCDTGDDASRSIKHFEIPGDGVAAVHCAEDFVRAALSGHVEVAADLRQIGHCF